MGKLKSFGRGILYGMRTSLAPAGAAQLKIAGVNTTQEAAKVCRELATEKRPNPCEEVKRIVNKSGEQARKYQRLTRGTSRYIPTSGDERCRKWLKGYYEWTAELFERESEKIEGVALIDVPKIDIPSMPSMPSMPSFSVSGTTKTIIMLIVGFIMLIMLLAAMGYSGMGGSVGRVAESEVKRKRG